MTRNEKKLLIRTIELGVVLTFIVVLLDGFGVLDPLERYLYEYRARDCQFFTPPPTDRIVHLDIDDPSLAEIGSFPWRRTKFAQITDEVHLAGAKVLGMDIIFAEPQETRYQKEDEQGKPRPPIEDDRNFSDSVRKAENVLLPLSLNLERVERSAVYQETYKVLVQNLEMDASEVAAKLRGSPVDSKTLLADVKAEFSRAREEAMFRRVEDAVEGGTADAIALHEKLTPLAFKRDLKTDASFLLDQTLPRVQSMRNVMRFTIPLPSGAPPLAVAENEKAITIPILTDAIRYCGYVDFIKSDDGVVRTIPLFVNYRGRLLPHMAMATACAILDVDVNRIEFTSNTVILPLPDGRRIVIPVRTVGSKDFGVVGMLMDIPWFGNREWKYAFDPSAHQDSKQHIPLNTIWRICELRRDLEALGEKVDDALLAMMQVYRSSLKKSAAFVDKPPDHRTTEERAEAIKEVVTELKDFIDLSVYEKMKPAEMSQDEKLFVPAYRAIIQAQRSLEINSGRIQAARASLRSQLNGRAAVIGWTVTGNTDTYTTSVHPSCPGVVIQTTAVNAIVTHDAWWPAPWWQTAMITCFIGIIVTLIAAWLQPKQSMICTLGLMAAYFVINGIVLFDWANKIYGVAAPLATAFLVWTTLTVVRYISEKAQRRRIENRFRSYVDPELVDFVKENEDTARIDGQLKTMTVVFTDLAGFTSISEKLRERTVPLLNRYMSLMLPIIRKNRGLWNKFLGDGIMFFFNAPRDNPDHARDAVRAVMDMQNALIGFNEELKAQDLPSVAMRAGISTGPMIVGDAGSTDAVHGASDYTVLGDEVNLGARLESANKYLGSRTLLNEQAAKLCGDEFLLRPMGNLCVVGKTEGVMTFEAICRVGEGTPQQKRLAELSKKVVDAFRGSDFGWCLEAAKSLEKEFGPSKFTELYLNLAQVYLVEPPGDKFDGQIVLSEK